MTRLSDTTRIFVAAFAVLFVAWIALPITGPVDDAYITMTYSRNLAAGAGIVFNPGEVVEGCTAFGQMILLAVFALVGVRRLDLVAVPLGLAAWAGVFAILYGIYRRERDAAFAGRTASVDVAGALFLLLTPASLVWSSSAMETPIVALLYAAGLALHLREHERGEWPFASALVTVGAGLMRPDAILLAVPLFLSWLLPWPARRDRLARAALFAALVIGLFGAYWLWRWHYFGYFMPNTFAAKVGSTSWELAKKGVQYWLAAVISLVFPAVCAWRWLKMPHAERLALPRWWHVAMGMTLVQTAYVIAVGGDFFPFHRFFVPVMAPAALAAWRVVRPWWDARALAKGREPERSPNPRVALGLFLAWWLWSGVSLFLDVYKADRLVKWTHDWGIVGRTLAQSTPEGSTIATLPIGALGYHAHRRILDMVGLVDLHIGRREIATGQHRQGHEKFDTRYVLDRAPDVILTWPERYEDGGPKPREWQFAHTIAWAQRDLYIADDTLRLYVPVRFDAAGQTVYGLLRRDLVGQDAWRAFEPLPDDIALTHFAPPVFKYIDRPSRKELMGEDDPARNPKPKKAPPKKPSPK